MRFLWWWFLGFLLPDLVCSCKSFYIHTTVFAFFSNRILPPVCITILNHIFKSHHTTHGFYIRSWLHPHSPIAKACVILFQIYPLWFECRASDLPGIWLSRYPAWGEHNRGLDEFSRCKQLVQGPSGESYMVHLFSSNDCPIGRSMFTF